MKAGAFRTHQSFKPGWRATPARWWFVRYTTWDGDEDTDTLHGDDVREEARTIAVDAGGAVVAVVGPFDTNAQALAAMAGVQL